ncbi:unnamed protein product, partial [marine sediment metagenome]
IEGARVSRVIRKRICRVMTMSSGSVAFPTPIEILGKIVPAPGEAGVGAWAWAGLWQQVTRTITVAAAASR